MRGVESVAPRLHPSMVQRLQVGLHKFATRSRACAEFKIPTTPKVSTCTDFRRKFVPTNLQASVVGRVGGYIGIAITSSQIV